MALPIYMEVESNSTTTGIGKETLSSGAPFSSGTYSDRMSGMETNTPDVLRRKIKAARLHAGYTQEKLVELIGVSKSAVSMWETSNPAKYTRPTLDNLKSLSQITGAPLDWLLDDGRPINGDWKEPVEIIPFPASRPAPAKKHNELAAEAARIIESLPRRDQLQILHYLRIHAATKGLGH